MNKSNAGCLVTVKEKKSHCLNQSGKHSSRQKMGTQLGYELHSCSSFLGSVWFPHENNRSRVACPIAAHSLLLYRAHGHSYHDPGLVTHSGLGFFVKLSQMPSVLKGKVRVRTQRGKGPPTRGPHSILVTTQAQ